MRIDDLDHLPETTTIDASSIGIVQVSGTGLQGLRNIGASGYLQKRPEGLGQAGREQLWASLWLGSPVFLASLHLRTSLDHLLISVVSVTSVC